MLIFYIYNLVQLVGLILLAPFLFVKAILTPRYRGRMLRRLGKGLVLDLAGFPSGRPRIWIHALSVGETASARSMIKELRQRMPDAVIIFSATTRSGEVYCRRTLADWVDVFVSFPFDIYWIVKRFVRLIDPDLFVLIETDFWPNFLHILKAENKPSMLVNGRVSTSSFRNYRRLKFFFRPMFVSFDFLAMQTDDDVRKMVSLGVEPERVKALGNLKYDTIVPVAAAGKVLLSRSDLGIPEKKLLWIAGSTHPGEEEILFRVFNRVLVKMPELFLVVAPRSIDRGDSLLALAEKQGLIGYLRTDEPRKNSQIMILNTMGELAASYGICDLAFVGASLVCKGGHNPLEPAGFGKPVLFGPYMDDFSEISRDLLQAKGCLMVQDEEELCDVLEKMVSEPDYRIEMGRRGAEFVLCQQGVTEKHLDVISRFLKKSGYSAEQTEAEKR